MTRKDYGDWNPKWSDEDEREIAALVEKGRRGASTLKAWREKLGITQEEFAELLGVTQSNVSKIEAKPALRLSALRKLIEHKGGRLRLVVEMDGVETELPISEAS